MSWPKHLTVDKRIVLLLSASTYENFPRALRELVSNAYDADATTVTVDISSRKKTVIVNDNGSGMTPDEFDFFLSRIRRDDEIAWANRWHPRVPAIDAGGAPEPP